MKKILFSALAAAGAAMVMVACGGSGTSSTGSTSNNAGNSGQTTTSTISGSAVKGPVANATVTVKNAATGAILATTTTNATGGYSVDISHTGDVIIEVSGGTYTDEATGNATTLSTPMKVVLNVNGNVTGMVTPLTTMAYSTAFGSGSSPVTSTAFNNAASQIATQFQLTNVNLATTLPSVSGTAVNDYGRVLRAVSKYLETQNVTLETITNASFTAQQLAEFSAAFTTAYGAVNPGSTVTFSFSGNVFNISGTGVGGGTGTCGVNVQGTVTAMGITMPLNLNYCISGIAAGSCNSGNSSLSQALSGQSGVSGAANLNYSYSASCAQGAITINLQ